MIPNICLLPLTSPLKNVLLNPSNYSLDNAPLHSANHNQTHRLCLSIEKILRHE